MPDVITIVSLLLIGIAFILLASKLIGKKKRIIQNGIEVDGIIFGFEYERSSSSSNVNNLKYPLIRFLTKEGEWFTEKSDYGSNISFLKKGTKVKVIYNATNPKEFIFKTSFDFSKLNYLFLVAGIIFFIIGLWLAYKYLTTKN